eukprot:358281-Chlamydomonas_euryale.AAC.3
MPTLRSSISGHVNASLTGIVQKGGTEQAARFGAVPQFGKVRRSTRRGTSGLGGSYYSIDRAFAWATAPSRYNRSPLLSLKRPFPPAFPLPPRFPLHPRAAMTPASSLLLLQGPSRGCGQSTAAGALACMRMVLPFVSAGRAGVHFACVFSDPASAAPPTSLHATAACAAAEASDAAAQPQPPSLWPRRGTPSSLIVQIRAVSSAAAAAAASASPSDTPKKTKKPNAVSQPPVEIALDGKTFTARRAPTAINLYVKDAFGAVRAANPNIKSNEVFKKTIEAFKALGPNELSAYTERAARAKAAFDAANEANVTAAKKAAAERSVKFTTSYTNFVKVGGLDDRERKKGGGGGRQISVHYVCVLSEHAMALRVLACMHVYS